MKKNDSAIFETDLLTDIKREDYKLTFYKVKQ